MLIRRLSRLYYIVEINGKFDYIKREWQNIILLLCKYMGHRGPYNNHIYYSLNPLHCYIVVSVLRKRATLCSL